MSRVDQKCWMGLRILVWSGLWVLLQGFAVAQEREQPAPEWAELATHEEAPDWFRDAKFGIYFHWGPYAVPAYGNEHYPRTMYGHPSGKMPVKSEQKRNYNLGVGFQTFRSLTIFLLFLLKYPYMVERWQFCQY